MFNYRPRGRRNELPPEKRSEIARLFWLGVPAARVAEDLGIHRNPA
jgi:DNA-directed RNA polymerase specialized sigma24 family protein